MHLKIKETLENSPKMSDHIPFEIQAQIMKRLPAKKLIQSKMVSKQWKSLIESSRFMADYNLSQTGPDHVFIRCDNRYDVEEDLNYVSFLDDKTFPQDRFVPILPESFKLLNLKPMVVGSSHGLFCLYGEYRSESGGNVSSLIILWNPSIDKSIALDVAVHYAFFPSLIGFGVRPDTCDPMLVKVNDNHGFPWTYEVFRLSTGVWTSLLTHLPRESIQLALSQVDVNGFIYWNAYDKVTRHNLIVSFDLTSEKFAEVNIPKCLASKSFQVSNLRGSLGVIEYCQAVGNKLECAVWMMMMMEDGVEKTFTKLYTVSTQNAAFQSAPLGFRKCGNPIMGTRKKWDESVERVLLSVYEPHSKNFDSLGIYVPLDSFSVHSYTETLLLLGHPDNHGRPVPTRAIH